MPIYPIFQNRPHRIKMLSLHLRHVGLQNENASYSQRCIQTEKSKHDTEALNKPVSSGHPRGMSQFPLKPRVYKAGSGGVNASPPSPHKVYHEFFEDALSSPHGALNSWKHPLHSFWRKIDEYRLLWLRDMASGDQVIFEEKCVFSLFF